MCGLPPKEITLLPMSMFNVGNATDKSTTRVFERDVFSSLAEFFQKRIIICMNGRTYKAVSCVLAYSSMYSHNQSRLLINLTHKDSDLLLEQES